MSTDAALEFAEGTLSPDQRERVEAHADGCAACRALLVGAVRGLNTGQHTSSTAGTTMLRRGMIVAGRFEILRFVAHGGMGEVYEAFDGELEIRVALKTIATSISDSERAVRYLKTEVLNARRIAHPNVCRIYEWGTHVLPASRAHFFTMEFVRGERLSTRLRRDGPLAIERAIHVARQLLSGLAAAHEAEVLHRDFKSDNVILDEADGRDRAVILDFGLARLLDREAADSSSGPVGTRAYMAPEQLRAERLAPSADIYSFGVVLFEILTGRRPFEAEDGTEPTLACLYKIPVAPSRLVAEVPPGLDQIVLRCLRREPLERYQTAHQVLAALDVVAPQSEPVKPPLSAALPAIGATLPAVVIATGLVLAASYATYAERERSRNALMPGRSSSQRPPTPAPTINQVPAPPLEVGGPPAASRRAPPKDAAGDREVSSVTSAPRPSSRAPTNARSSVPIEASRGPARPKVPPPGVAAALQWEPFDGPDAVDGGSQQSQLSSRKQAELKGPP